LGAIGLAKAVIALSQKPKNFKLVYKVDLSIFRKLEAIDNEMYGAAGTGLSEQAKSQVDPYTRQVGVCKFQHPVYANFILGFRILASLH